jgi:hypothetical protein
MVDQVVGCAKSLAYFRLAIYVWHLLPSAQMMSGVEVGPISSQYRFTSAGALNGHALGNLLLTALWDRDGDQVQGIERVGDLLRIQGRVLPMALDPLDIEGTFNTAYGRKNRSWTS